MPGVSADNSTHYRFDAAARWLTAAMEAHAFDRLDEVLEICIPSDPDLAPVVAEQFIDLGLGHLARLAFDLGMRYWPTPALEARRERVAALLDKSR